MTFIAALDQSGGSTPGTLERYGYSGVTDLISEQQMDLIHEMRLRIINSPAFSSDSIDTAIIFEDSARRGIVDVLAQKGIQSYLKIDKGLYIDGTMNAFDVQAACNAAQEYGCTGTKMRSVVNSVEFIEPVLKQQFRIAETIAKNNLVPIVEPEVPIMHPEKFTVEVKLFQSLINHLQTFPGSVILKLTIPEQIGLYSGLTALDSCERVVALSGGYSTDEACNRLSQQKNVSASFSRALTEGLDVDQTEDEFNAQLQSNINKINKASTHDK